MTAYGDLTEQEITEAKRIKEELLTELTKEFVVVKAQYDDARHRGVIPIIHHCLDEFKVLNKRMIQIRKMSLPKILSKHGVIERTLQKEFKGDLEHESPTHGKVMVALVIAMSGYLLTKYDPRYVLYFFIMAMIPVLIFELQHKHREKLVAVKTPGQKLAEAKA